MRNLKVLPILILLPHNCAGTDRTAPIMRLTLQLRHVLTFTSLLILVACATPPKTSYTGLLPEITAPRTLEFLGDTYTASYSAATPGSATVEYFLPGEGPHNWTRLLGLRLNRSDITSSKFISGMARELEKNGTPHEVAPDPGTGGNSIDFMALIRGNDPGLEFNIFRAINLTNEPGIISFQYAQILNKKGMPNLSGKELRTFRKERNAAFGALLVPIIHMAPPVTGAK